MSILKCVMSVAIAVALTACGGGGGNSGSPSGGASEPNGGGNGGSTASATLVVKTFNSANVANSNITFSGGNYVKATFKDQNGAAIVDKVVTFSLNGSTIANLSTTTALTNSLGEAQITIAPATVSTVGAGTISAKALNVAGTPFSGSTEFSVSAGNITLGSLVLGNNTLSSGGNTSVTITAQSNSTAAAGVNVSLTANCGVITSVITTNGNGQASGTYSAVKLDGTSCSGPVSIGASTAGATAVPVSLTVAASSATAINFISAIPSQVFVKGSGATEQSIIKFKVLDSTGADKINASVTLSLSINPGGVGLGATGATGNYVVNSDGSGIATASVFSGTVPGPVEVKAALTFDPNVFTVTKNLTVASGPPSQNHFSLSVETFNIEGQNMDGTSTNLTVRVADRQGNPVPNGTVINFTAEGGQVATSCATALTSAGHAQCSVGFISQNPRPGDGRVSVLAYAEGLKEFTDLNGNNAYDSGADTLIDIGDAYRDDNEDAVYNSSSGEFLIQTGGSTICTGSGRPFPSRANTCTGNVIQSATVRQQAVLMFASSNALFTVTREADGTKVSSVADVRINSANNVLLPMPAGTTISVSTLSYTFAPGATVGTVSVVSPIVPNVAPGTLGTQLGTISSLKVEGYGTGTKFRITATSPSKSVSNYDYTMP